MPMYHNPNPHPVAVTLTAPRVSITVYPWNWAPSRVPHGGRKVIELDALLARELVKTGMLEMRPPVLASVVTPVTLAAPNPVPEPPVQAPDLDHEPVVLIEDEVEVLMPTAEQLAVSAVQKIDETERIVRKAAKAKAKQASSASSGKRRFYVPEE